MQTLDLVTVGHLTFSICVAILQHTQYQHICRVLRQLWQAVWKLCVYVVYLYFVSVLYHL
jgi:hypothetical protein